MNKSILLPPLALFMLIPASLFAEEIRLYSDAATFDGVSKVITADGDVRASWKDSLISSSIIKYYIENGILEASGDINVKRGGESIKADDLTLVVPSGTGIFKNTEMRLSPDTSSTDSSSSRKSPLVLKGKRVEKKSERDFSAQKASFTTCEADPPSWRFDAESLDMTIDGYAEAKNAVFRVGEVPIFYTPYIFFPVKTERQSGLLLPQFGRSSEKGFIYRQPLYLVISPSFDTTLTFSEESRRGEGVAGEFRYLRKSGSSGTIKTDIFSDRENSSTRGMSAFRWLENFSDRISSRGDLTFISYKNYFSDFGNDSGEYNRGFTDSVFSLESRGDSYQLAAGGNFYREIEPSSSEPVNTLPYLDLAVMRKNIGNSGVYASVKSRASHFSKSGSASERIYLSPELSSTLPLSSWLNLSLSTEYKLSGYRYKKQQNSEVVDGYGQFDGKALLASGFEKDYGVWRHLVLPSAGFNHKSRADRKSIPLFDSDDITENGDLITWEILNLFEVIEKDAKGALVFRDAATLKLSGTSRLSGERADLLESSAGSSERDELRLETTLFALKKLSLYSDTRYNPSSGKSSSSYLSIKYDLSAKESLSFGYYQADQLFSYMEGGARLYLSPFSLEYRGRYSFDRSGFLESLYRVEYRQQCWGVGVSYRERPGVQDFMFSVTLAGL